MEYQFSTIEKKWQDAWKSRKAYQVPNESTKPKCYVLDMFPYPSGAGLHVGHPLGYIASDIYSRYKRLKGFNVLHPMGYDAFGLPAEQYAIEHGVHPAKSTHGNIDNFRKQLDNIGFSYDWEREVRTCDASYYKWTQWIFLQLFNSYYDRGAGKAKPINELITVFEKEGNGNVFCPGDAKIKFDAASAWKRLRNRYRLIVMNDDTYEEVTTFRLTRGSVYVGLSTVFVLLVGLTTALIVFTPLKYYIPGAGQSYQSVRQLKQLQYRVDSIERQDAYKTQYILGLKKALGGGGMGALDTVTLQIPVPEIITD